MKNLESMGCWVLAMLACLGAPACGPPPDPRPASACDPCEPEPPAARPAAPGLRQVTRVVDGDTLQLEDGARVRLLSANTPEKREELGPEASQFTRKLLQGKKVRLVGDQKDAYGRLLADVHFGSRSLAVELLSAGMAHLFIIPPPPDPTRMDALLNAQRSARQRRLGIWATPRYQGALHITSFHANSPGNDRVNLNGEYLRIACVLAEPCALRGYRLHNARQEAYTFGDVLLPPGHTVKLHSGAGADRTDPQKQMELFWGRTTPAWSNQGDTATLLDPEGHLVDRVAHKVGGPRKKGGGAGARDLEDPAPGQQPGSPNP